MGHFIFAVVFVVAVIVFLPMGFIWRAAQSSFQAGIKWWDYLDKTLLLEEKHQRDKERENKTNDTDGEE